MPTNDNNITPESILRALEGGEFEFWYQPKVSFLSGHLCGCEALVRWRSPKHGLLSPAEFLPVIENAGINTEFTLGMFPRFHADHKKLISHCGNLTVAFNVYAQDLSRDDLVKQILGVVSEGVIKASQIQVELTESAIATGSASLIRNVHALVEAGVGLAMDDFGTGYSSLDTLRSLPFSVVKIDQGVVGEMLVSRRSASVVHAGIRLAHELNVVSVAEGVESQEIYEALQHNGCTEAQGYWISRPLPLEEFIDFASKGKVWGGDSVGLLRHIEFDHIEWRRAILDQAMKAGPCVAEHNDVGLSLSSRECRFGRWFHGEGRSLSERSKFESLESPHDELHTIGKRFLSAVESGAAIEEVEEMAAELNACSERLLRVLQSLEVGLLLKRS